MTPPSRTSASETQSLNVWMATSPVATGLLVRRRLVESGRFTSVRLGEIEVEIRNSVFRELRLAPDNPFLSAEEREPLDADGLVRVGQRLGPGAVLASIVAVIKNERSRNDGLQRVLDSSVRLPWRWENCVVHGIVRRDRRQMGRTAPRTLREHITILLQAQEELAVGDVLTVDELPLGVVARFVDDAEMPREGERIADVVAPFSATFATANGERMPTLAVTKSVEAVRFSVHAHTGEPYALITQQPRGGLTDERLKTPSSPRPATITTRHVQWLRERGANRILGELLTLKSDDARQRDEVRRLREAGHDEYPEPGVPESLYLLRAELMSLGLTLACSGSDHVAMSLRPATREELVSASSGAIHQPNTLHYQTLREEPGGMFCPRVFGHGYRFGHFELPTPIVPYLWRVGSPSPLARLLELTDERLDALVHCRSFLRILGDHVIWHSHATAPEGAGWRTGGDAVLQLLKRVPRDRIPPAIADRPDALVQSLILLPPPFVRPIVLLDSGNFATSDLNELYRQVINRANRLRKLIELKAIADIERGERRQLQETCDQLWANSLLPEAVAAFGDSEPAVRLRSLLDVSLFRLATSEKRVGWSGQARAAVNSELPPGDARMPAEIFDGLHLRSDEPVLLTNASGAFVPVFPQRVDERLLQVSPQVGDRLQFADSVPVCDVHVPLDRRAREEAWQLLVDRPPNVAPATSDELVDAADTAAALQELVNAALTGRTVRFASPRGLLAAGVGPVTFVEQSRARPSEDPVREVPVPPMPARPPGTDVAVEQIRAIVNAYRRKTCIFHLRAALGPLPPDTGRIGGHPWLPHDVPWPMQHDKPVRFVAQLPLDCLQGLDCGAEFAPGSLLTIFWGDDWWERQATTGSGSVFVVSGDLQERKTPQADLVLPLLGLEPEVMDEVPTWQEMREILELELTDPKPHRLTSFHRREWPQFPEAREQIKLGGWPRWIQSAATELPLLAQLTSSDEAGLMFGDGGALYVFDGPRLETIMQCY